MGLLEIVIFVLAFFFSLGLVLWVADAFERERRLFREEEEAKVLKKRERGRPRKNAVR